MVTLREAAQQALEAMEDAMYRADTHEFYDAKESLRAALAEPQQESTPIYLAEVTMPEPLAGGYIVDDCLWCSGASWCLECRHEWVAVWPLAAESLECPACGSTDTDRDQAGPHKRKGEQYD